MGYAFFRRVPYFKTFTHVPNEGVDTTVNYVADEQDRQSDFSCDWFGFSYDGGDEYYPGGHAYVNMDMFTPTSYGYRDIPTWIFHGNRNTGKKYLASHIHNKTGFCADDHEELPDTIKEDVVITGSKHNIEEIKKRIEGQIIEVNFSTDRPVYQPPHNDPKKKYSEIVADVLANLTKPEVDTEPVKPEVNFMPASNVADVVAMLENEPVKPVKKIKNEDRYKAILKRALLSPNTATSPHIVSRMLIDWGIN